MHPNDNKNLIYSPKCLNIKNVSKECIFLKSTAMGNSVWGKGLEIISQALICNLHDAPNSISN